MGRHQAPARHRRKSIGGRLAGALRPGDGTGQAPPATAAPWSAPSAPGEQEADHDGPRLTSWWLLLEVGVLTFVVLVVGVLVLGAQLVVDGVEVVIGAGLLLAPLLVRHVVLEVHRRWLALGVAYAALLAVAFGALAVADLVLVHTAAGFGAAGLGVLAAGAGFVLTSRLYPPRPAAAAPTAEQPVAAPAVVPPVFGPEQPDESDTDTLPQIPHYGDDREDDSLAG